MSTSVYQISAVILSLILFVAGMNYSSFGQDVKSPRAQLEEGVAPEKIVCKAGYTLVIFRSDLPACLTPSTVVKLEERGYIKTIITEFKEKSSQSFEHSFAVNNHAKTSANIENIPASPGSIVNFFIIDDDLNTSPNGVDVIDIQNLVEFTINGIVVKGPKTMIETGPNTGKFYVKFRIPDSINGKPITQDDIIAIRYFDQTNASGNSQIVEKSISLRNTFAKLESSVQRVRIGHPFILRIYEPDANLDSEDIDKIPLSRFEYRSNGGIRTTLANSVFDANAPFLYETEENSGIFEVMIKIPRIIDGKPVHIGDWFEITFVDVSTPSNTAEDVKLRGKVG